MIDFQKITASSIADGFKNYKNVSFSVTIPSQSIGPADAILYTASAPLDNANSISEIQIKYTGLDNFWRSGSGLIFQTVPNMVTPQYQIGSYGYFQGGNLYVSTYVADMAGGVTIPTITVECRGFLFLAPFA